MFARYNTPGFATALAPELYDGERLADAIAERVPRDARLRVLGVQAAQTLDQRVEGDPLVSTVSVVVRAARVQRPRARVPAQRGRERGAAARPGAAGAVKSAATIALAAALLAAGSAAQAQGWHLFGSNTARIEHYDNGGDPGAPFFPAEGYQSFDELSLGFARRVSPWESVRGQFLGLANGSDLRSTERGLLLERGSVTWEKGDTGLPYRATAGDCFGYLSLRTLQRPLKGVQVDLQPRRAGPGGTPSSCSRAPTGLPTGSSTPPTISTPATPGWCRPPLAGAWASTSCTTCARRTATGGLPAATSPCSASRRSAPSRGRASA